MHILAHGKINLTLDVNERGSDGYHQISTVMQTIRFADVLEVTLTDKAGRVALTVEDRSGQGGVPTDETNLAHRAATAILNAAGSRRGARIRIEKYLPHQAGLGGGSSDAAATLRAVNSLLGSPLTHEDLTQLASGIGGDVAFFLTGGTCLVEGMGEQVTPLPDIAPRAVVIVKPKTGVSTSEAYAALDRSRKGRSPSRAPAWDGVSLRNDFEEVVEELCPPVAAAKQALLEIGCKQVLLCGSGSAVFGFIEPPGSGLSPEDVLDDPAIGIELAGRGFSCDTTVTAGRDEMQLS